MDIDLEKIRSIAEALLAFVVTPVLFVVRKVVELEKRQAVIETKIDQIIAQCRIEPMGWNGVDRRRDDD